jgi:hypothetical protein
MSDTKTRLLNAERALHRLELQFEQFQLHLAELGSQPHEAEKAHAVLSNMRTELERQRMYCQLLVNAATLEAGAMNGSRIG